jgi:hypothetical protein
MAGQVSQASGIHAEADQGLSASTSKLADRGHRGAAIRHVAVRSRAEPALILAKRPCAHTGFLPWAHRNWLLWILRRPRARMPQT